MFCHKCGATIGAEASICPGCGDSQASGLPDVGQRFTPRPAIQVQWGRWIGEGRRLVFDNLGLFVPAMLVQIALESALRFVPGLGRTTSTFGPNVGTHPFDLNMRDLLSILPSAAVNGPLTAGAYIICILKAANREAQVSDLFGGFRFFWWPAFVATLAIEVFASLPTFLVMLMSHRLTIAEVILCAIPGGLIAALYVFTYLFIVDKRMSFWAAMQSSLAVVRENYFGFVVFLLMLFLVNLLGFVCCFVGVLVSMPVSMVAITLAYRDIAGFDQGNLNTL